MELSFVDRCLCGAEVALRTLSGGTRAQRPVPTPPGLPEGAAPPELAADQRRHAAALRRINHVGEVCAQALYQAQALTGTHPETREQMRRAAREEIDHLAWTEQRLAELGDRPSLLNPLWYGGAFALGLAAGRLGDRTSLGFVVETERQVEAHLGEHLEKLPADDVRSRTIVHAMKEDEARHADKALAAGAQSLPAPVPDLMRFASWVMKTVAYRI